MGRKSKGYKSYCEWYDIYRILKELYITSFEWVGLPDTVNERFLELSLYNGSYVSYFEDEVLGHLALQATLEGGLDVYYEPTKVRAYGGNGYQNSDLRNHKNCVVIYNNSVRDTPIRRLKDYAWRIWNIERTIDVNVHAQKTPVIFKTTKNLELTVKNILNQFDNFYPNVVVDKDLMVEDAIKAIQIDAPFVAGDLFDLKKKIWNEALSYIGIENNSSEKGERLVADEILVSNGFTIANRNSRLQARQRGADEINRIFYDNEPVVSVKVNNLSVLQNEAPKLGGSEDG